MTAGAATTAAVARPVSARRRTALRWAVTLGVVGLLGVSRAEELARLAGPGRGVLLQAVVTGLLLGGVYGLVSMGLTLVFGVLDIVNFAHGALMTVGMYAAFVLGTAGGLSVYAALPIAVLLLLLIGAGVQKVLVSRVMGQPLENQLLLTLGLSIVIENALLLGFTATPRRVTVDVGTDNLDVLGAVAQVPRVIAFVAAMLLAVALYLVLQRTRLGTAIRAVAQNPRGAQLVGIDVGRIHVLTFALGVACAGAAGVLVLPFLSLEPTTGAQFNILAFVIVVLGGMGNVVGAVIGGLLIGLVQEVGGLLFPEQSDLLLVFIVFVLVLFLRPQGLLSRRAG